MTTRDWIEPADPISVYRTSASVSGYVHQVSRAERTVGLILGIGLAVVLVVSSF